MTKIKKHTQREEYDECWLYILLLTTLVILLGSLKTYTFKFMGVDITFAIFFLPLIYFIANYITKKYDYKKTVAAIAISGVMSICFMAILYFALGKNLVLSSLSGEFCGYVISQFVNLTIYSFLMNNTKSPAPLIFLTYIFSLIVFYMFYTLIYLNMIILDTFWTGYLLTIGIQSLICIPLTIFDKLIKRGRDD